MPDANISPPGRGQNIMTILDKSQRAQSYYESYRSKSLHSGFEKFVATDGTTEMFVNSDYEPENSEIVVFKLDTRNGQTGCQLFTSS